MSYRLLDLAQLSLRIRQLKLELTVAHLQSLVILSNLGCPLVESALPEYLQFNTHHIAIFHDGEHIFQLEL